MWSALLGMHYVLVKLTHRCASISSRWTLEFRIVQSPAVERRLSPTLKNASTYTHDAITTRGTLTALEHDTRFGPESILRINENMSRRSTVLDISRKHSRNARIEYLANWMSAIEKLIVVVCERRELECREILTHAGLATPSTRIYIFAGNEDYSTKTSPRYTRGN